MPTKPTGNPVGCPTKMTPETVQKLEEGFLIGLTDRECCLFGGIVPQTLYNYIKEHPDFSTRKELLKDQPRIKAKQNIVGSINDGNVLDSKWYAERKSKKEFSVRTEVETSEVDELKEYEDLTSEELRKLIPNDTK